MTPLERRKFELHADSESYHHKVVDAEDWVHRIFDCFDNPCLNYSGGKDSLVLLLLVAQQAGYDTVDVFHFDNGLLDIPGVDDFVQDSATEIGGNLHSVTSEAANDERMVLEQGHGYNGFWGQYTRLSETHGWDVRLLGIRAQESREREDRFESLGSRPPVNRHEQHTSAAPIHRFTARDVWAYIVANDLDYHPIYDDQGALYDDMESNRNRLVTLYDSEFDSLGAREISQFIFPGETNALKDIEQSN